MSTPTGHSALHARHPRHRSSALYTPSSPNPASPSICPLIASRSTFARPRVESDSSRVAIYDGHIVPESFLRHAPTPLHMSTAPPKPPYSSKSNHVGGFGVGYPAPKRRFDVSGG